MMMNRYFKYKLSITCPYLGIQTKEAQAMTREIILPKQRIDIYDHKNMILEQSFKLSE